jgi:hypothetical protein
VGTPNEAPSGKPHTRKDYIDYLANVVCEQLKALARVARRPDLTPSKMALVYTATMAAYTSHVVAAPNVKHIVCAAGPASYDYWSLKDPNGLVSGLFWMATDRDASRIALSEVKLNPIVALLRLHEREPASTRQEEGAVCMAVMLACVHRCSTKKSGAILDTTLQDMADSQAQQLNSTGLTVHAFLVGFRKLNCISLVMGLLASKASEAAKDQQAAEARDGGGAAAVAKRAGGRSKETQEGTIERRADQALEHISVLKDIILGCPTRKAKMGVRCTLPALRQARVEEPPAPAPPPAHHDMSVDWA